jgi:tRNA modification GTPase
MEHQSSPGREELSTVAADGDTIVAVATPPGRGGIGVVRLSGPAVAAIAEALLGHLPAPRHAWFARFLDEAGEGIDAGIVLYFKAPNSYTGEDVLELHAHGSPVLLEALVARCVQLGARRALPGEFTQRAYLNERIDLAQAEAVADLIGAGSEEAARAAVRSLEGEFSRRVLELDAQLATLRVHVEAAIDFPSEEIEFLADPAIGAQLDAARAGCEVLLAGARTGRVLTEGLTVVIAGAPNAGKSTLLNRLAGHEVAIVSELPGTTRDLLRERVLVGGVPMTLIDTAGLRDSDDAIEQEGVRRARAALAKADHVLYLIDAVADAPGGQSGFDREQFPPSVPVTRVHTKCDLPGAGSPRLAEPAGGSGTPLRISAKTGAGLEALTLHLLSVAGFASVEGGTLSARARHVEALRRCQAALEAARMALRTLQAGELVAEELKGAQRALGEITGQKDNEALLGRIFAGFCIGK